MPRLKTLLTLLLVIFGTLGLAAAPSFGERPFIDIFQVPDSAMEARPIPRWPKVFDIRTAPWPASASKNWTPSTSSTG